MPAKVGRRLQLFNDPGELGKIGQVWFIESLADDDIHTGRRLREDLEDLRTARRLKLRVVLRRAANRAEFSAALEELRASVVATGLNPILDIECHGDDDLGLQLADGSLVAWDELKAKLEAINVYARFNLILVLGCCYGAYFGREARLYERAPFVAYIAPTERIEVRILAAGLHAFYEELFTSFDISNAVNALGAAAPGFGYLYSSALGLFRSVFGMLIREEGSVEGLRRRAQAMVQRAQAESGKTLDVDELARFIKAREPEQFEQLMRTYFAFDLFPENAARFPLTYADVQRDAVERATLRMNHRGGYRS
jgi:hypothetical protein